jgi:Fe-S-cluster containining protein
MEEVWYQEGLRFECTGCGRCCTGPPGYVWVKEEEIRALAQNRRLPPEEFSRLYLRRVGSRHSLLERPNGDCIFYQEGQGCSVYSARPLQCRTFPFWPEHLRRPSDWEKLKAECEGAGQGRLYPLEEIRTIRLGKGHAPGS